MRSECCGATRNSLARSPAHVQRSIGGRQARRIFFVAPSSHLGAAGSLGSEYRRAEVSEERATSSYVPDAMNSDEPVAFGLDSRFYQMIRIGLLTNT